MKTSKLLISSALLSSLVTFAAIGASAHSFPEEETPSAGQSVNSAPLEVSIKYDAPIEKLFAKLEVLGPDGKNESSGDPQISTDGRTLSIKVESLKPGNYTVRWAVVCIDTHHTQGSYNFTVTGGGS